MSAMARKESDNRHKSYYFSTIPERHRIRRIRGRSDASNNQ